MKTACTLFITCLFSYSSFAQPGTLDSSFGTNGKTIVLIPYNGNIYGSTLAPDDKPIAVGSAHSDLSVLRFTIDGLPDQNFGDNGLVTVHFPDLDQSQASSVVCQTDNKTLVSGYGQVGYFYPNIQYTGLIVRFNETGKIDSTFGENGILKLSKNGNGGYGPMAIFQDSSFIVIGDDGSSVFLNHFEKDGKLDEDFGENGYTYLDTKYSFQTLKIESDGKIIIAGSYAPFGSGIPRFFLQRFLPDGTIDKSFGKNGIVTTLYEPNGSIVYDLGFQSDGKIIAFGLCDLTGSGDDAFATVRYSINGTLDSSFGLGGKSTITFDKLSASGKSIAVMTNNKLILGGGVTNRQSYANDNALVLLNSDGSIDSTFGTYGKTITDLDGADAINEIFLQKTEKIVTIGESDDLMATNCSLARYTNDGRKKQIIIKKIKHYIATHNNAHATSFNNVSIYPNPAQNVLHVAGLSSSNTKLTVVNFMGNVKLQTVANTSSYNLNIAALTPGNYLLKIEMNDAVVTKKFVKQ